MVKACSPDETDIFQFVRSSPVVPALKATVVVPRPSNRQRRRQARNSSTWTKALKKSGTFSGLTPVTLPCESDITWKIAVPANAAERPATVNVARHASTDSIAAGDVEGSPRWIATKAVCAVPVRATPSRIANETKLNWTLRAFPNLRCPPCGMIIIRHQIPKGGSLRRVDVGLSRWREVPLRKRAAGAGLEVTLEAGSC